MSRAISIFLFALLLRLALFAIALSVPDRFLYRPDSFEYDAIAQNLLAGHGFSQSQSPPYKEDLVRTPIYPAVLAAISFLTNHNITSAILANLFLGAITVVFTYGLASRFFDHQAGLVAAGFLATDLTSITYNNLLLTETTFTAGIVIAVWKLLEYSRELKSHHAFSSGIGLGLSSLCRPIGIFLAPALFPLFVWQARGGCQQAWLAVRGFVVLNLGFSLVVGIWLLRNFLLFGGTDFSSVGAINLYFHRAAFVQARLEGIDVWTVQDRWESEFAIRSLNWSEPEKIAWLNSEAQAIISTHPIVYLQVYLDGLFSMFGPEHDSIIDLLGVSPQSNVVWVLLLIGWIQLLVIYTLAMIGVIRAWRNPRFRPAMIVLLNLVLYFVVIVGPEAYARFRVPLMPFLVVLAGLGVWQLTMDKRGQNIHDQLTA